jgi:hypothetical protein
MERVAGKELQGPLVQELVGAVPPRGEPFGEEQILCGDGIGIAIPIRAAEPVHAAADQPVFGATLEPLLLSLEIENVLDHEGCGRAGSQGAPR